ncbi:DUF2059 domain-containing protein [Rhizobium sp. EC-SD404]|uniref:DUF2059 domain-containing protein n=1 Tax=Rhizobium sp. EC-SD404 TaxID=2038389 RepID=UPI00125B441B|nr:DUF2059 domain-containing protein [Rhizobium sp. EC-SD404]VVT22324.1 conserved hypothetical protein [Rhizobium sp. EC-SD404]
MAISNGLFRGAGAAALIALTLAGGPALSQEQLSDSHRAAARAAIAALGATDQFDQILPGTAEQLKSALIQSTPNFESEISSTIDDVAVSLASRRGDLEREAAEIYARNFTEEELNAITEFYTSSAGLKLLENGITVTQELMRSAEIWATGISRDLAVEADAALEQRLGDQAPTAEDAGIDPETGTVADPAAPPAQ